MSTHLTQMPAEKENEHSFFITQKPFDAFIICENREHSFISNISYSFIEVKLCRGRNTEEAG